MKTLAMIASLTVVVALTACGEKHEKVHAVDRVEEAQKAALEKTPKAEEMTFEDHGQPTFAQQAAATPAATDTADAADTTDTTDTDASAEPTKAQ